MINQIVLNVLVLSGIIFYLYIAWRLFLFWCERTGRVILKYSITPLPGQIFISPMKKEEGPWQRRDYAKVIEVKDEWVLYNEGYMNEYGRIVQYQLLSNPRSSPISKFLKKWECYNEKLET